MHKHERQNALVELIRSESISSQSELASRLSVLGYRVTQASVSRDIDELGIVKKNGYYVSPKADDPIAEFGSVRFDTAGETLIVGKCASGLASAITVRIDAAAMPEIVGTIAGDDTIFIAIKDGIAQKQVLTELDKLFESK